MTTIKSPCILVCAIEPASGLCYGCGRSRDEIAGWSGFTDAQRDTLMAELPDRVAQLDRKPRRVTRRAAMRERAGQPAPARAASRKDLEQG